MECWYINISQPITIRTIYFEHEHDEIVVVVDHVVSCGLKSQKLNIEESVINPLMWYITLH